MSVDGEGTDSGRLPPGVAAALAMAEIPPSKLGPARRARLTEAERELYVWILRRFATAGRPSRDDVRAAAERRGLDTEHALAILAREDLVHRGADGEISVAYPFSGRPTAHRARFSGGHAVDAMCAIDALGVAPMLGEAIEVGERPGDLGARRRPPPGERSSATCWHSPDAKANRTGPTARPDRRTAAPRERPAGTRLARQETLTTCEGQVILTAMVEPGEVVAQAASEDPEIGLRAVASLRALLEAVEELQVRRARELGWSWQQIAALLGVSKQAVHQKYGKGEPRRRRRLR